VLFSGGLTILLWCFNFLQFYIVWAVKYIFSNGVKTLFCSKNIFTDHKHKYQYYRKYQLVLIALSNSTISKKWILVFLWIMKLCLDVILGIIVVHCYDNWLRTGRYRVWSLVWVKSLTPGFALINYFSELIITQSGLIAVQRLD